MALSIEISKVELVELDGSPYNILRALSKKINIPANKLIIMAVYENSSQLLYNVTYKVEVTDGLPSGNLPDSPLTKGG